MSGCITGTTHYPATKCTCASILCIHACCTSTKSAPPVANPEMVIDDRCLESAAASSAGCRCSSTAARAVGGASGVALRGSVTLTALPRGAMGALPAAAGCCSSAGASSPVALEVGEVGLRVPLLLRRMKVPIASRTSVGSCHIEHFLQSRYMVLPQH